MRIGRLLVFRNRSVMGNYLTFGWLSDRGLAFSIQRKIDEEAIAKIDVRRPETQPAKPKPRSIA